MSDRDFYPHRVTRLERRDTHISTVFLTGEWAYKIKKPVNFGFLDFTTLEERQRLCRQEVSLNQRLTHDVYMGVVAVRRDESGRLSLEGSGRTVEVAVKMKQLPEDACLGNLLERHVAGRAEMEALGRHLAIFYQGCAVGREIDRYGHPEVVGYNMEENFEQVEPYVGSLVKAEEWEFIRQVSRTFLVNWEALFLDRIRDGRIRDGHGDLRVEHIYWHGGLQIIDCIEFNDRFRYGDAAIDLAFLHMDMERLGHADLSRAVMAAYVRQADDPELYALLDFYAAYRAVVKLKVACLGYDALEEEAARANAAALVRTYEELAYRYAIRFGRPTLWVFCGLPATGKTSLAAAVAGPLRLRRFSSDSVRKQTLPGEHVVPYGQGIYRPEMRGRVYSRLLALAQDQLKSGHSVILDATFAERHWREEAARLARDLDANLVFVECAARMESIRDRLEKREREKGESDARLLQLPEIMAHYQPPDEVPPANRLRVDTDEPVAGTLFELLERAYVLICGQVSSVL